MLTLPSLSTTKGMTGLAASVRPNPLGDRCLHVMECSVNMLPVLLTAVVLTGRRWSGYGAMLIAVRAYAWATQWLTSTGYLTMGHPRRS